MNQIINLLDNFNDKLKFESDYIYNGITVPRVTKIISKCIHSDSLMRWANSLGFKHQSYNTVLNRAADIGSQCHSNIDQFMDNNNHIMHEDNLYNESFNAYNSFRKWFDYINNIMPINVIFHEKTLVCPYFGGTIDGLYNINGKIYLVDYKTSNSIKYSHFLQLSAYRFMLKNICNINIDGCIILQLSKTDISYKEYVLNFNNIDHLNFINSCEAAFLSMVYSYYNILKIEQDYNKIIWGEIN